MQNSKKTLLKALEERDPLIPTNLNFYEVKSQRPKIYVYRSIYYNYIVNKIKFHKKISRIL